MPTHHWKNLLINFVRNLLLFTDEKSNSYDSILIIVNRLTKIVYNKSLKVTINISSLAEVIINVVMQYHGLLYSIISDRGAIFMSKFWFLLCYFLDIKR